MFSIVIYYAIAVVLSSACPGATRQPDERAAGADSAVYAREAQAFLSKRDQSVQPRQIAEIWKAVRGETNELASVRSARNVMAPLPAGVEAEWITPKMRLYRPLGGKDLPLLVYLHGGGWVIGSVASCSAFCGALAGKGVAVVAFDYPLAPEHPYPAALNAVCAAYREIAADPARFRCDVRRIALGGDSSGGNLALAAALALQKGGEKPCRIVVYYPVTEARVDGTASWRDYATGYGMDGEFMAACNAAYLQGQEWNDALVSPMCADDDALRRLPPIHVLGADCDVLRDQGKAFADRLEDLGCEVRYELPRGTTHLYITVPGQPAAFRRAVDFAAEAMR
ncbi:MAG: alpha/beta hydrolase [Kiritimatiellia bacterium]